MDEILKRLEALRASKVFDNTTYNQYKNAIATDPAKVEKSINDHYNQYVLKVPLQGQTGLITSPQPYTIPATATIPAIEPITVRRQSPLLYKGNSGPINNVTAVPLSTFPSVSTIPDDYKSSVVKNAKDKIKGTDINVTGGSTMLPLLANLAYNAFVGKQKLKLQKPTMISPEIRPAQGLTTAEKNLALQRPNLTRGSVSEAMNTIQQLGVEDQLMKQRLQLAATDAQVYRQDLARMDQQKQYLNQLQNQTLQAGTEIENKGKLQEAQAKLQQKQAIGQALLTEITTRTQERLNQQKEQTELQFMNIESRRKALDAEKLARIQAGEDYDTVQADYLSKSTQLDTLAEKLLNSYGDNKLRVSVKQKPAKPAVPSYKPTYQFNQSLTVPKMFKKGGKIKVSKPELPSKLEDYMQDFRKLVVKTNQYDLELLRKHMDIAFRELGKLPRV